MTTRRPTRNLPLATWGGSVLAAAFAFTPLLIAQPEHPPAPIERRAQPASSPPASASAHPAGNNSSLPGPGPHQQHLPQWLDSHRGMSLADQQSALQNEPGFRQLKPQEQQRMLNRLQQLNSMAPQQQQRIIQHGEAMESLPPAQRQQVRAAMAQLGGLPEDRRHAVGRTFQTLRGLPQPQQQAYLNSIQFRNQFNEQERATVVNLLNVAPVATQAGLPGFAPRTPSPQ